MTLILRIKDRVLFISNQKQIKKIIDISQEIE